MRGKENIYQYWTRQPAITTISLNPCWNQACIVQTSRSKNRTRSTYFQTFNTLHKKWSFLLRISSFTKEILNGKVHILCSDSFLFPYVNSNILYSFYLFIIRWIFVVNLFSFVLYLVEFFIFPNSRLLLKTRTY